jgi:isoleucyl-tRNA synthetase
MGKDKTAAYQTLYECLVAVVKLMAPFAPFLAEELYRNLNSVTRLEASESVHLALLPRIDESVVDAALERRMKRAEKIVMLVRSMRMKSNLKVRQPLRRIILPVAGEGEREEIRSMEEIILDEVNVKALEYVSDESGLVRKRAKANFKSIGPKHGKSVQRVAGRIRDLTPGDIMVLEAAGSLAVNLNGGTVTILRDDVEIVREDIQGWLVESDGSLTVALDTQLDAALIAEGVAREFVSRVQNMRKDAGFAVTDRIAIFCSGGEEMMGMLRALSEYIAAETLAVEFTGSGNAGEYEAGFEINGQKVRVGIERRA